MARYPEAEWHPSPNFGYPQGEHGRNGYEVRIHVNHTTASDSDKIAHRAWFLRPDNVAPHFCIFTAGEIDQYVDTDDAAWHAGIVNKPDPHIALIPGVNPNLYSIGIEWQGQPGELLTESQILAGIKLHQWLDKAHPLFEIDRYHVIGHYQIDSVDRANDPGPAFPWDRLLAAIKGDDMDIPTARWNVDEAIRQLKAILNGGSTEGLQTIIRRLEDNVVGNLQ